LKRSISYPVNEGGGYYDLRGKCSTPRARTRESGRNGGRGSFVSLALSLGKNPSMPENNVFDPGQYRVEHQRHDRYSQKNKHSHAGMHDEEKT
jgi:hypothetical protein